MKTFKALESVKTEQGNELSIIEKSIDDLPEGELLIKVNYSSLNYKDALSASGAPGVTRNYPHTPGIDAVGSVTESLDKNFKEGDSVIVTGYDLGMNTAGGFGEYIRVPSPWAVNLPSNLSEKDSMSLGTAGLTAGLSIQALDDFNSNNGFDGKIDEVAIWSRALELSDVQRIYNATNSNPGKAANLFSTGLSQNLVYWNRMGDN